MNAVLLKQFENAVRELAQTECEIESLEEHDRCDWSSYKELQDEKPRLETKVEKLRKRILAEPK